MSPSNRPQLVAVLAWQPGLTNGPLVEAWRRAGVPAELLNPAEAARMLRPGDVAVVRLDVLPTLDGVEAGLEEVEALERRGVRVLNRPAPLLAAHDKWETAGLLGRSGLPHPGTACVRTIGELGLLDPPFVVKPRFGSWGKDVLRCRTAAERERCLDLVRGRRWFQRHGAIVQELLPPADRDLRLLVAGGRVVGAGTRRAAPGEWRTNVSLGGSLEPAVAPASARALGMAAAEAIGADLIGVDLFPSAGGELLVLELNGAAEFDERYSLGGKDVFVEAARALNLLPADRPRARASEASLSPRSR